MADVKFALVGAGSMGKNHARTIARNQNAELALIVDVDARQAEECARQYGAAWSVSLGAIESVDAVVLASPTPTHRRIALDLIAEGIPILIEKPIATSTAEVVEVLEAAERAEVPLVCGFVERFNPVVKTAVDLINLEEEVLHITARRHSPVTRRSSSSVTWDLLIHDVDLVLQVMRGLEPDHVSGRVLTPSGSSYPEVADATLGFMGAVASLSSSRISHRKIRDLSITTAKRLYELDLLRQTLTVYKNIYQEQIAAGMTTYRAETVVDIPFVRHAGEPLELQLQHFIDAVSGRADLEKERNGVLLSHAIIDTIEEHQ